MHDAPDPLRRGYMLNDLGSVAAALGLMDEAISWDRQALGILRPTASPRACTTVGWRLGNLLAQREEWAEAAAAFEDAVEAAELSFHGRLATTARQDEIQRVGNLNRWAAFAIARAGDALGAALALENGRARELRRRVGLDKLTSMELADVPDELVDALEAVGGCALDRLDGHSGRRPRVSLPGGTGRRSGPCQAMRRLARARRLTTYSRPSTRHGRSSTYPTPYGTC